MRRRGIVCGRVALRIPAMDLHDSGKKNRKKYNEEYDEGENVLVGEVAHKCPLCSTSNNKIVK